MFFVVAAEPQHIQGIVLNLLRIKCIWQKIRLLPWKINGNMLYPTFRGVIPCSLAEVCQRFEDSDLLTASTGWKPSCTKINKYLQKTRSSKTSALVYENTVSKSPSTLLRRKTLWNPQNLQQPYRIISYYLFSFRGSLQDCKIHMGIEIVIFAVEIRKWSQCKIVQQF